jgi:hypothetical protein
MGSGASDNGSMTLHVPRLPFALDPLIAEAKRRARQRRLLVVALALALVSAGVGAAFALRPSPSGSGSGAVSPSVAVVASQPVLSLGSRGPVVAAWQRLLDGWLRQSACVHIIFDPRCASAAPVGLSTSG